MSSCECDLDTERVFPKNIACVLSTGFSTSIPAPERIVGFGGREVAGVQDRYITTSLSLILMSDQDVEIFWEWYRKELDFGKLSFVIELPIFGGSKSVEAKFVGKLSEGDFLGSSRKIGATIEVANTHDFVCNFC